LNWIHGLANPQIGNQAAKSKVPRMGTEMDAWQDFKRWQSGQS
jgi:hypothetical protein